MSQQTKIEWCDSTVNFWEGCTKVSSGCANCYAEARDRRFTGGEHWGTGAPRRKSVSAVKTALGMNWKPFVCKQCGKGRALHELLPAKKSDSHPSGDCDCGGVVHVRRIFSLSLGDWLDDEVPIPWLVEMLDTIRICSAVRWILCTKRPELWRPRLTKALAQLTETWGEFPERRPETELWWWLHGWLAWESCPRHIVALASVENQDVLADRVRHLLEINVRCHGLSLEPLLGPVELTLAELAPEQTNGRPSLNWLIVGGESGPGARSCAVQWVDKIVDAGRKTGAAVFVKQLGTQPISVPQHDGATGYFIELKHRKGADVTEWSPHLRVQQWPKGY